MPQQIKPNEVEVKAKPKDEAISLIALHPIAVAAYNKQLLAMKKATFLNRTYEKEELYFLVFKPFNKTYKDNFSYYNNKALDAIRKNINNNGTSDYFISREIKSKKVHYNALCYSKEDFVQLYDKKNRLNKFRVHCKRIPKRDRWRVMSYITKESRVRPFIQYRDYNTRVA